MMHMYLTCVNAFFYVCAFKHIVKCVSAYPQATTKKNECKQLCEKCQVCAAFARGARRTVDAIDVYIQQRPAAVVKNS